MEETIKKDVPVLPIKQMVAYPGSFMPLNIGRAKSIKLINDVVEHNSELVLVCQRDGQEEDPKPEGLYDVGCFCRILKHVFDDGNCSVIVQGINRVFIDEYTQDEPFFKANVKFLEDIQGDSIAISAEVVSLKKSARELLTLFPEMPVTATDLVDNIKEPSLLADMLSSQIDGPVEDKQKILECLDVQERLKLVLQIVQRQLDVLKLSNKINDEVDASQSQAQREYYLRQQLKAIKNELGENGEDEDDVDDLEAQFKSKTFPEEAKKVISKELRRLRHMNPMQSEYLVARNYIECLLELPWSEESDDCLDLDKVRQVLDADHYGLEKIKKRIIEYLAVRKLKKDQAGPILCFVGPPGVGKTSLARSIAKALGREFIRGSMGGVRDEAEIRGHRRTYVGAMPGRILMGMKKAGKINPLFTLDEIDKLAHDVRGDPASALLEVLDPEQNNAFSDHYLNIPYDLSKVFFVTTANQLEPIPSALKDRMEILEIPGYTLDEKLNIARSYLLPKQLEAHGLSNDLLSIDDATLCKLIEDYTREAGVRNLNREIAAVCRGVAVKVADGDTSQHVIDAAELQEILGPARYFNELASRTEVPGVATGMAWTPAGGDILFIEASQMKGKGGLLLTGQLGDVMKESAQAALSYVRSKAVSFGIDEDLFSSIDIHLHVPAGAIPKDGPSAGVTILTALVSLLTNKCVYNDISMTGEITLRGNVLPVGGIKEKVLAARRAGVKRIILPERNRKDLVDIPENCRNDIEFFFASRVDDVLNIALRDNK